MTELFIVDIKVRAVEESWAIFDWINEQNWEMEKDYNYRTPFFPHEEWHYRFRFRQGKDATAFALRWAR